MGGRRQETEKEEQEMTETDDQTPTESANLSSLSDLCTPWCIHVVATLRIADHIASGITHIDDLAAAAGANCESLHRVLRYLVSKGIFEEAAAGSFALNEPAHALLGE